MLGRLKEAYPQFTSDNTSASDFSSEKEEMRAEIERLKKKVEEKEDWIMKLIDLMYGDEKKEQK